MAEQVVVFRGSVPRWEYCLTIARRKTGPLFAFSAYVCGGHDEKLSMALLEAGYAVGTAYQLADDILDATGTVSESGKTLGSDSARSKTTAATAAAHSHIDTAGYVDKICADAEKLLEPWPTILQAWQGYMKAEMRPALTRHLSATTH